MYPVLLLLLLTYVWLVVILGIFVTIFRDVMGIIERDMKFSVPHAVTDVRNKSLIE